MSENSTHVKSNKIDKFTIIPNWLIQSNTISPSAKATAMYLESKPSGWKFNVSEIRKVMQLGDHTWRKVSSELTKLGLLSHQKKQKATVLIWNGLQSLENFTHVDFQRVQNPHTLISHTCETDALIKTDHVIHHDDHEGKPQSEVKVTVIKPHDYYKKQINTAKLTSDEQAILEILLGFGWKDFHATAAIKNHAPVVFYDLFDQMHKRNVKNKGAYIRASLRKLEEVAA